MNQHVKNLTKKEWRFLVMVSLLFILVVFIPTIYGLLITPPEHQFTGLKMPNIGDYKVFYSRIEQSRQGHIFHQYLYSGEDFPRVLFFPIWTIMGLTGRFLFLSSQQSFYFFQLILIPLLVFSIYFFIKLFIKEQSWQKITLLATLFSTGSDWLFWPWFLKKYSWLGIDLNLPDAHVFTSAQHSPHLIFLLILICWLFIFLDYLKQTGKIKYAWLAGIFSLTIFLSHPFQVIPILGTIAIYYLFQIIGKKNYWLLKKLIPFFLLNLGAGLYLFILWYRFEIIRFWNAGNLVGGYQGFSSVVFLSSTFSFFLILAVYKIYFLIKEKKAADYWLLLIWLVVGFISVAMPLPWKGKMILGLSLPLTILGCLSLKLLWQKIRFKLIKYLLIWLLVLTLPSGLYLILYNTYLYWVESQKSSSEHYLSNDTVAGFKWLRNLPDNSLILSSNFFNMFIPAYSGRKVYLGFSYETYNYYAKLSAANDFFQGKLGKDFLINNKINYVVIDLSLEDFNRDYLGLIFSNPAVKVYQVL